MLTTACMAASAMQTSENQVADLIPLRERSEGEPTVSAAHGAFYLERR